MLRRHSRYDCNMVQICFILLTLLPSIAADVLADHGTVVSIPADNSSALQDYLCNEWLPSNTTLMLQQGIHVISCDGFWHINDTKLMNFRLSGVGVQETTVICTRKWGIGFSNALLVAIDGLTFVNCGADVELLNNTSAVLYLNSSYSVSVSNVSFLNTSGFGVLGNTQATVSMSDVYFGGCAAGTICIGASFTSNGNATLMNITRCSFVGLGNYNQSHYDGAAGLQLQGNIVADIRDSFFVGNKGAGLFAHQSNLNIFNCSFSKNVAYGGAALNVSSIRFLNVTGSRFYANTADNAGAAMQIKEQFGSSYDPVLVVSDCYFQDNHAETGGGMFMFDLKSSVVLSALTFVNNSACIGAALYAGDTHNVYGELSFGVSLIDVAVVGNKNNYSYCTNGARGAVVYYNEINYLNISGSSSTGSRFVRNYPQGAIQGIGANLHLSGMVSFVNNSGENGAAIYLTNDAHLYFHVNCTVDFFHNVAMELGGAIYIEGDQSITTPILTYCAVHFIGSGNYSINFQGNHANVAGNSMYATPIYDCFLESNISELSPSNQSDYENFYTIHNSSDNQILSFPVKLDLCSCTPGIKKNETDISIYPGATLQCNATLTDYAGSVSPSVVFAQVVNRYNRARLAPQQEVQWISDRCTPIEYQMYGPQNTFVNLSLSTKPGQILRSINMTLQRCEAGFTLQEYSVGLLRCECSSFLSSFGATCDINQGTVRIRGLQWIGMYDGNEAIASTCPLRYCNPNDENIRLGNPSDICAGGRIGVLCGKCPDGLSVVFGSDVCQKCSDVWLLTILLYALIGVLLVAALFLLNITVTSGTLYGLIFYANILAVNGTVFFTHSYLMPLEILVSLINLDLGFPLCFYDGMDDLAKTGLQFVFPAYLLLISITIAVASKYCLNWSSAKANSLMHRIRKSIGTRAVNVLATLIYLSYSKVLRTVIDILTYADVQVNNNSAVRVWFYDGTIHYLSRKHIALFCLAMVAIVVLFLYTFALTIMPIIVVLSGKHVFCMWLNKKVIYLPVHDAYYSPYKDRWRIWLGARLWLVVLLYSLGPFLGPQNPSLLLLIHAILVIMFAFIQIHIMPFGEAVLWACGKCKHNSLYMYIRNLLDLFFLMNYSILALVVSYLLKQDINTLHVHLKVVLGVFVGLSIIVFFSIVILHAIVTICKTWSRKDATPLASHHPTNVNNSDIFTLNSSTYHFESDIDVLREPLLDDSSKDLHL